MYNFLAEFFLALVWAIIKKVAPPLAVIIMKRKTPEQEAEMNKALRSGQDWDHFRNRPKERH